MQVGASYALDRDDWIFPSYRESAIGCCAGCRRRRALLVAGPSGGLVEPRSTTTSPRSASRSRRTFRTRPASRGGRSCGDSGTVAIAFFGDGATSEGAFHEGANFAGVMRAPLVLFCNNNQWAISTPLSAQTAAPTLADKAIGYGMPGVRVDGADVLAVYEATRDAVARARAGDGPTFIEAVTYRTAPHATADDPSAYIDHERVEEEKQRECVGRYEAICAGSACLTTTPRAGQGRGARDDARGHRRGGGRAAGRSRARLRARLCASACEPERGLAWLS
jgi:pyruvate dehydrogenase E1 component alpha subunit